MGSELPQKNDLRALLEPSIQALGFELVDVELGGRGGEGARLRLFIDSAKGVNVDDCARVSRQVSAVLDVEDPIAGRYLLEVSSPGLDRPLVKRDDYLRYVGAIIRAKTTEPILGRKNFTGRLLAVGDDRIEVEVDKEVYDLAFANIEKARLVPEL